MLWPEGKTGFSLSAQAFLQLGCRRDIPHLYFFGYVLYNSEDGQLPAKITRRSLQQVDRPDLPQEQTMDMEDKAEDLKRKGPDSRTVVLASEKKRQRYEFEIHDMFFAKTLWWMMQRPRAIRLEPHQSWYEHEVRWMCKGRNRTTPMPIRGFCGTYTAIRRPESA